MPPTMRAGLLSLEGDLVFQWQDTRCQARNTFQRLYLLRERRLRSCSCGADLQFRDVSYAIAAQTKRTSKVRETIEC